MHRYYGREGGALEEADLPGSDAVEWVGEHEDGVPEGVDAVPGWRDAVLPIAQDHWLHRSTRQECP